MSNPNWLKKSKFTPKGHTTPKIGDVKLLYIGDYKYVNISSFVVLGLKLWMKEDDDLNRNDLLYSFGLIQSKPQDWYKTLLSFSYNFISSIENLKILHICNQQ